MHAFQHVKTHSNRDNNCISCNSHHNKKSNSVTDYNKSLTKYKQSEESSFLSSLRTHWTCKLCQNISLQLTIFHSAPQRRPNWHQTAGITAYIILFDTYILILLQIIEYITTYPGLFSLMLTCKYVVYLRAMWSSWQCWRACRALRKVIARNNISARREMVCFYHKISYLEDVLGIGLQVTRHPVDPTRPAPKAPVPSHSSVYTSQRNALKTLSSPLDLISKHAFVEDVLRGTVAISTRHYWGQSHNTSKVIRDV